MTLRIPSFSFRLLIAVLLSAIIPLPAAAQKEHNMWYFGDYAGIDFNTTPPSVLTNSAMITPEGVASIADENGNLLFYTNGVTVYNKNHAIMFNGNGLAGHTASSQSACIVPLPDNPDIYYVFTVSDCCLLPAKDLRYSVIDMTRQGGLGEVVQKNVFVSGDAKEKLCIIKHSNGADYWIVVTGEPDIFRAYYLSASGLNFVPVNSSRNQPINDVGLGYLKVSPSSSMIVAAVYSGLTNQGLYLYDFNNTTGVITNKKSISANTDGWYGVEFSPSGRYLYATMEISQLYQFDVQAGDETAIRNSAIQISNSTFSRRAALQIAPDNKIYVSLINNQYVGVISNPDDAGVGCNYADSVINLGNGRKGQYGLPNNVRGLAGYAIFSSSTPALCEGDSIFVPFTLRKNMRAGNVFTLELSSANGLFDTPVTLGTLTGTTAATIRGILPTGVSGNGYKIRIKSSNPQVIGPIYTITIHPKPAPDKVSAPDHCAGDTVIYNLSNSFASYKWRVIGGTILGSATNPTVKVAWTSVGNDTVYCAVASAFGCVDTGRITLNVYPNPIVSAGADLTICQDSAVVLDGKGITPSGTLSYQWSPALGLNRTDIPQPQATPPSSMQYVLTVTASPGGCVRRDSVFITVNERPTPVISGVNSLCSGDTVSYSVPPTGGNAYLWSASARGIIISRTSNTVRIRWINTGTTTTTNDTVRIREYITTTLCHKDTFMVISITPAPLISAGQDIDICRDSSAVLQGTTNLAAGTFTASWLPVAGLTNPNTLQPVAKPLTTTQYILTVKATGSGCVSRDTVRVTVSPPLTVKAGADTVVCLGSAMTLNAVVNGTARYEWTPTATIISGATTASPIVAPTITTQYVVTAIAPGGCRHSDTIVVRVAARPDVTADKEAVICPGGNVVIGSDATGGTPPYRYEWSPTGGLSSAVVPRPLATPLVTTTYRVVVTDKNDCHDTSEIIVRVRETELTSIDPVVNFGQTGFGKLKVRTLRFVNTGSDSLTVARTENLVAPFSVVAVRPPFPAVVKPGDTIEVDVQYKGTAGTQTSVLRIAGDVPCRSSAESSVQGEGADDPKSVLAQGVDFGNSIISLTSPVGSIIVVNDGETDGHITDAVFESNDEGAFSILSWTKPFLLRVGDTLRIPVTFTPPTIGLKKARVRLESDIVPAWAELKGTGVLTAKGMLKIAASDFDTVCVGDVKRLPITVENNGTAPLNLIDCQSDIPAIRIVGAPFTPAKLISVGASIPLEIETALSATGTIMANLRWFADNDTTTTTATVVGKDCSGLAVTSVGLPDLQAEPGERVIVPLILQQEKGLAASGASSFTAKVLFNGNILFLDDPSLQCTKVGQSGCEVSVSGTWQAGNDTLVVIRTLATLGEAETTTLTLTDFRWTNGATSVSVNKKEGIFTLKGICYDGGARLYRKSPTGLMLAAFPNPASDNLTLSFGLRESGWVRLALCDALGQTVRILQEGNEDAGIRTLDISTSDIGSGAYTLTLTTVNGSKSLYLGVVK